MFSRADSTSSEADEVLDYLNNIEASSSSDGSIDENDLKVSVDSHLPHADVLSLHQHSPSRLELEGALSLQQP